MHDVTERWLPIAGFEGLYEVSDSGRVRSLDRWSTSRGYTRRCRGRILAQRPHVQWGYPRAALCKDGVRTDRKVHQLVLETFVGPRPSPEIVIRHLNGNPADNRLENLAYGTASENAQDTLRHGSRIKPECRRGHLLSTENLYVPPKGGRICRTCQRISWRKTGKMAA